LTATAILNIGRTLSESWQDAARDSCLDPFPKSWPCNHVLAVVHYCHLFGRDLGDKTVARAVNRHLTQVTVALIGPTNAPRAVRR
jgi:hypothetical protein